MADLAFTALSVTIFAVLFLLLKGMERGER